MASIIEIIISLVYPYNQNAVGETCSKSRSSCPGGGQGLAMTQWLKQASPSGTVREVLVGWNVWSERTGS
jgi:hypothetical protein